MQKGTVLGVLGAVIILVGGIIVATRGGQPPAALVSTVLASSGDFTYETYSQERFDELLGSEAFVVFAHSKTCGTCARKDQQIKDEVDSFGAGTVLKLEYSEAPQDFLATYGVTNYDTFVMFNADGSHTTRGGATIEDVRGGLMPKDMMDKEMDDADEASEDESTSVIETIREAVVPTVHAASGDFSYQDFDEETFEDLRGSEEFAVFFASKTCGTCARKHQTIIDDVETFSQGSVLRLEYSEAPQDLIEELKVTSYDTFVTFDAAGNPTTSLGATVDQVRTALN